MKVIRIVVIIIFISFVDKTLSLAQFNKRANVWYFGYKAGLDFNSGVPLPLTNGALSIWEGCATICDENGSLLFYTDGRFIWNKNHQQMPGAANLGGDNSSSQSGIIVPQPDKPSRYFVFSVDNEGGNGGVQYAIVDITLNNGLGGLVSKNNRLLTRASEKLTAVRHCNNKDFWVITHELNNNSFRTFLINENGLSATSIESRTGSVHVGSNDAIGYMKASPNGGIIALALFDKRSFELFKFDNRSGIISNSVLLTHSDFNKAYGLEFSPDSKFLYLSGTQNNPSQIFQVDLSVSYSAPSILGSKVSVGTITNSHFGALQIGPNGKIYVAIDNNDYLAVINSPENKGVNCQFSTNGIYLSGKKSGLGLPNLITSYFYTKPKVNIRTTAGSDCNDITLFADATSNAPNLLYQWFLEGILINGANQSSFKPVQSGTYFVRVTETGKCVNDSIQSLVSKIIIMDANPQETAIGCGFVKLKANANGRVKWLGNGVEPGKSTFDTITIFGKGIQIYKLQVFNPLDSTCFIQKEISVKFSANPTYSYGENNVFGCDSINLQAPKNSSWNSYAWMLPNGLIVNNELLTVYQSGIYIVKVKDTTSGCEANDSVSVLIGVTPLIKKDETFCLTTGPITLQAGTAGNNLSYEWMPGGTRSPTLTVEIPGLYHVRVSGPEGCSATRNIDVTLPPIIDLGDDITLCEGETFDLKPVLMNINQYASYQWSTGETSVTIKPRRSGNYILNVIQSSCQVKDSIMVTINPLPKILPDESVCMTYSIEAGGLEGNLSYEWQNSGEVTSTIKVSDDGVYPVKITTPEGCTLLRTITVNGLCEARIFAPSIFTPNGDGKNETFQVSILGGTIIQFDVFNRWGNHLLSDVTGSAKWNGNHNGSPCPNGVYPYLLKYKEQKDNSVHEHRGTVIIAK